MKPCFVAIVGPACVGLLLPCAAAEVSTQGGALTIRSGERPVLEYLSVESPLKPYVRQLFTPSGINVVRDQVPDHIHHHGLMFAWKVDGVDFWGEAKGAGSELGRGCSARDSQIDQKLDWVGGNNRELLLVERRRIAVERSSDLAAHLVTWQATFRTPPAKDSVTITGAHYHGLAMRFLKTMDAAGAFVNSENKAGDIVRGEERLVEARWCAYTAAVEGKPVTIALFDGPGNPRPATFFTMARPFAYLAVTLAVHKQPLNIENQKPLTLTYGVAVWDGKIGAGRIDRLYRAWRESLTVAPR